MNSVRVTLSPCQLHELISFVQHYIEMSSPRALREAAGLHEHGKLVARLNSTLCTKLYLRLSGACLVAKPKYRMSLPAEMALALVAAWLERGSTRWLLAGVVIGNLHRTLA